MTGFTKIYMYVELNQCLKTLFGMRKINQRKKKRKRRESDDFIWF